MQPDEKHNAETLLEEWWASALHINAWKKCFPV